MMAMREELSTTRVHKSLCRTEGTLQSSFLQCSFVLMMSLQYFYILYIYIYIYIPNTQYG